MDYSLHKIQIDNIIEIALKAGEAILDIYKRDDFGIETKSDNSPLTLADKASHNIILKGLRQAYPEIPVLSEEGKNIPYDERKHWSQFWLVDPLDGTKEFIKRNGEFTVNIALIENNFPILGIIYAPDLDILYYGHKGHGAFKRENRNGIIAIHVQTPENGTIAVKSRSHSSEADETFFKKYNVVDTISVGSSLKFCMVAEGKAHIYYRHGPTWEWDTAAGQAIAEAAGARVTDVEGKRLRYNKEIIKNESFVVTAV